MLFLIIYHNSNNNRNILLEVYYCFINDTTVIVLLLHNCYYINNNNSRNNSFITTKGNLILQICEIVTQKNLHNSVIFVLYQLTESYSWVVQWHGTLLLSAPSIDLWHVKSRQSSRTPRAAERTCPPACLQSAQPCRHEALKNKYVLCLMQKRLTQASK